MNDPTHPIAAAPAYADDAYGWATEQVRLIRAGALQSVDWENIAEEIEDMGRSQYDGLESALRVLLVHLLKWEHQPLFRSRSWLLTIREQHRQFERRLARNPGLKGSLDEIRDEAYRQARIEAQAETGLAVEIFSSNPPGWNMINNPAADESDIPPR
jgi:hypothetical protein